MFVAAPAVEDLMPDNQRQPKTELPTRDNDADNLDREQNPATESDVEREQIRSSKIRDQKAEREGGGSGHDRNSDAAAHGQGGQRGPTDPDSAKSDIDRDDTITD